MTKQEQIEEMVSIMAASNNPFVDVPIEIMPKVAEALYNAGYRKLPGNSVVLSREEHERLVKMAQGQISNMKATDFLKACISSGVMVKAVSTEEQVKQAYEKGSKETVEKILDLLVPDCKACDENWHNGCLCLRATLAEKIAKQFGVEIKE